MMQIQEYRGMIQVCAKHPRSLKLAVMGPWSRKFAYLPTRVKGLDVNGRKFDLHDNWWKLHYDKIVWWRWYEVAMYRGSFGYEERFRREMLDRYNAWGVRS